MKFYRQDEIQPPQESLDGRPWSQVFGSGILDLSEPENEFFQHLLESSLKPTSSDDKQAFSDTASEMMRTRNRCSAAFLFVNILFVAAIVTLQSFTDKIGVRWLPWVCEDAKIEPLGFIFLIMFATVMLIQTIGMIFHRIGTFIHVMSITKIGCNQTEADISLSSQQQRQSHVNAPRRFTSTVIEPCIDDDDASDSDEEYDRQPVNYPSRMSRCSVLLPSGRSVRSISRVGAIDQELGRRSVRFTDLQTIEDNGD